MPFARVNYIPVDQPSERKHCSYYLTLRSQSIDIPGAGYINSSPSMISISLFPGRTSPVTAVPNSTASISGATTFLFPSTPIPLRFALKATSYRLNHCGCCSTCCSSEISRDADIFHELDDGDGVFGDHSMRPGMVPKYSGTRLIRATKSLGFSVISLLLNGWELIHDVPTEPLDAPS